MTPRKMKTKTAVLNGKPDAGNPHVRFDEGEVASYPPTAGRPEGVATRGAKPRRGSLLYRMMRKFSFIVSLLIAASGALGRETVGDFSQPPRGWEGLSVALLGDSITEKGQTSRHNVYWQYLSHWLKWDAHVYAASGHRWLEISGQVERLVAEQGEAVDAVLIMAGTNDFAEGVPLGSWYDEEKGVVNWWGKERTLNHRRLNLDTRTFCGRINRALSALKRRYPDVQIVVMTPLQRGFFQCAADNVQPAQEWENIAGLSLEDYVQAVKDGAAIWSCPVIDLYGESGFTPILKDEYAKLCRSRENDMLHPNSDGHRRLADLIYCRLRALPPTYRHKVATPDIPADVSVERANLANYAGRDHLGRSLVSFAETGTVKPFRQVGLFYYLWLGQHGTQGPYDVSKIEAADSKAMEKPDSPLWPNPTHAPMLHWGEPLFGYYQSTDEWVLRRHVQMFIDAGIDVLYFDTTNGYHYREVTDRLFAILQEYHDKGFKVPKFCYYMAPARRGSGTSNVLDVWNSYYKDGKYSDLYFKWDGKPLIITHVDRPYRQEILDFFTFRKPTWSTPSVPDTWYWGGMPTQNVAVASSGRREMLPVTVQTPHAGMDAPDPKVRGAGLGCSEAYWGAPIQGRSWHDGRRDDSPHAVEKGLFFQGQIDWALDKSRKDVPLAFVCQWNEWIVPFLTEKTNDLYGMPHWIKLQDEYNMEYSRDIEPMKGGYHDAYYWQLMNFVRCWKGLPTPVKGFTQYAPAAAGDETWKHVSPLFIEMTGDGAPRNHPGYDACGVYTNATVENEFVALRVAVGTDGKVRFWARTVKPVRITSLRSMNLFVRVSGAPVDGLGYTHRLTPNDPDVSKSAYEFVYAVEASRLGIDSTKPFSLEFKWSDNRQEETVDDFYVNGDAAPRGRVNWRFDYEPWK